MAKTYDRDADNTAVVIRTGSTKLTAVEVAQRVAAAPVLYLQLFNTASITPGTTAPFKVVNIPAGNVLLDANKIKEVYSGKHGGIEFGTALGYCVTTTHDGATAPTAGQEPEVSLQWEPLG
jgi:hypothetical protein